MKIEDLPKSPVDLGVEGHSFRWTTHHGYEDVGGIIEVHPRPDNGEPCEGFVSFDVEGNTHEEKWTVKSWDPLTLEPSLQCNQCNNHGYIREGKWVQA